MPNLSITEYGGIWCPKKNAETGTSADNLGGCSHCPYRKAIHQERGGGPAVLCALVPRLRFCARIKIDDENNWTCSRPVSLDQYRDLTGDAGADAVPEGFEAPFPTTFTKCLLCATQGRAPYRQGPVTLDQVRDRLQTLASAEACKRYIPPGTPAARALRERLADQNPAWIGRMRELNQQAERPSEEAG